MKKVIIQEQEGTVNLNEIHESRIYILISNIGYTYSFYILRKVSVEKFKGWIWISIDAMLINSECDISVPKLYSTHTQAIIYAMKRDENTVYEFNSTRDLLNSELIDKVYSKT